MVDGADGLHLGGVGQHLAAVDVADGVDGPDGRTVGSTDCKGIGDDGDGA